MSQLFADSFYFIALLNERDAAHRRAADFSRANRADLVTTRWVLAEVADALSDPARRAGAGDFVKFALAAPGILVMPESAELFEQGLDLYCQRPDKDWSLTDCISFVVMSRERLTKALTGDHHFEQAGFSILLK